MPPTVKVGDDEVAAACFSKWCLNKGEVSAGKWERIRNLGRLETTTGGQVSGVAKDKELKEEDQTLKGHLPNWTLQRRHSTGPEKGRVGKGR